MLTFVLQSRKRAKKTRHTVAYAGAPVDGRHEEQESQHGTFPEAGLGLERLKHAY